MVFTPICPYSSRMKTTLDIPDELFQRAKDEAHKSGTSFKAIVVRALEQSLGPATVVIAPLRTHVWPAESEQGIRIESDNILQMIRHERDGDTRHTLNRAKTERTGTSTNARASKSIRKVRK